MSLASRRMDRIDTKQKAGFSIVDLAAAFDEEKRSVLDERVKKLEEEEARFLKTKETKKISKG